MKTNGNFYNIFHNKYWVKLSSQISPAIRVKEFAKVEFIPSNHGGKVNLNGSTTLPDIETISLSSEEEIRTSTIQPTKYNAKTTKPRETRLPRLSSTISKSRTPKPPSKYKYHKIDEYFHATKKDCKY